LVSSQVIVVEKQRFFQKVFGWMVAGLFMTGIIAYSLTSNPLVVKYFIDHPFVFWGFILSEALLVIFLSIFMYKLPLFLVTLGFFVYAALNGVTLTLLLSYFKQGTIFSAFFITAGMFAVFALYGFFTKTDLTRFSSILAMFVIGLILASLVNLLFFKSSFFDLLVSYITVGLFCIITALDIQSLKKIYEQGTYNQDSLERLSILGALTLYLDFIVIFQNLLNILGRDD